MIRDSYIRPARVDDADSLSHVYVESWRTAYRNIFPQSYLDGLSSGMVARTMRRNLMDTRSLCLTAACSDSLLGYIWAGSRRGNEYIYSAEIYELYLLPEAQRQGIGRQLLTRMAERLHQARYYSLMVWVLSRNPSRRFYEKCGGIYLHTKPIIYAGQRLKADAYGWIDITLAMQK
jgi:GNAT superfamily N-acetyltransferase